MESGPKNREKNTQDELYRDIDTQMHQDWIDNGNNQDRDDYFEDEDLWSALQSRQDGDRKKEISGDVIEDDISDDDLDLASVQKLASPIPPSRTPIISDTKKVKPNKVQRQTGVKKVAPVPQKETEVSVDNTHGRRSGVGGKSGQTKRGKKESYKFLFM